MNIAPLRADVSWIKTTEHITIPLQVVMVILWYQAYPDWNEWLVFAPALFEGISLIWLLLVLAVAFSWIKVTEWPRNKANKGPPTNMDGKQRQIIKALGEQLGISAEERSKFLLDLGIALRMSASFTRSFEKKRYAALVFAQSWQAIGTLSPTASLICSNKQ
jgi:hypothetical protein